MKCQWCDVEFSKKSTKGPVPKYCKPAHRQRAYEARRATMILANVPACAGCTRRLRAWVVEGSLPDAFRLFKGRSGPYHVSMGNRHDGLERAICDKAVKV